MKKINTFQQFNESYDFKFSREQDLKDIYTDLQDELNDLEREKSDIQTDMEEEAGEKGESWTDADANRYGALLNKKEAEIEKKTKEVEKAKEKYYNYGTPRGPREKKPGDSSFLVLKNHLEDVKKSIKAWPDRTDKEQATIYKKRYDMGEDIPSIIIAIEKLKTNKLI